MFFKLCQNYARARREYVGNSCFPVNFTQDLIAFGLKLVLLLVSKRLTMTQIQRRHQRWEMFHNYGFMNYTRRAE